MQKFQNKNHTQRSVNRNAGFTLMEIVVSATLFAVVSVALLSLFNYTLKINRQADALRQAAQGTRDFVEYVVKEVRNGQINYLTVGGLSQASAIGPCTPPSFSGVPTYTSVGSTYGNMDNKIAITTDNGQQECMYYGDSSGNYATTSIQFANPNGTLVIQKVGEASQILNPANFKIQNLVFIVRPTKDPYSSLGGYVGIQPMVSIVIKFVTKLPTGEQVPIYYQTSVSTNKYDIPNK